MSHAHSVLGASASHRWMACPGSVRLSADIPEGPPSEHALEGTAAHELAETCLNSGKDAVALACNKWPVEMTSYVQVYLDHVRAQPGTLYVEQRFTLERLNPPADMFGTADAVVWDEDNRRLFVGDLKYGRGVVVEVEENPQLMYYALGAVLALNVRPDEITVCIVQPRADHPDGPIREWTFSWDRLVAFKQELLEKAELAMMDDSPIGPVGEHCKWCRAKAICPAQMSNAVTVAQDEFALAPDARLPEPSQLTEDQILLVLDKAKYVEDWFSSIREYVKERLERGEEVPGWKLVDKRASRVWADEAEAEAWLRQRFRVSDIYTKKLLSPYQAEQLVKDRPRLEVPEDLIYRKVSGTNLVPESNPKPAVTAGAEFDTIPNPQ